MTLLNRVVIAPDASWIATCGNSLEQEERPERAVRVWDSNTGRLRREFDAGYANGVGSMLVTPQHHLATAGTTNPGLTGDPVVRIFDSSTGRCLLEYETPHPHGAGALWLSSPGKCVVTAGRVFGDRWWYVNMHRRVNGRTEPISPGLPDPHADRGVCLLDPAGQRPGLAVDTGHQGPVTKVLFGPDDRWFATVSTHDPVVRWWETATGEPLMNIDTGTDRGALLVSPDGRRMVTRTADGRLRRWDTSDGRELDCVAGDPTIGHAQLSAVSNHRFAVTGNDTVQRST
ncbi:WD40 repeat domain-containing protein [Micromonospora sp. LOL_023]|uniref:WD40 repeat domain-containing protein n=1 Tax=Micromonospora sp. LOL_023 TaxID=3345418 RepID=UPI003A8C0861